MKKASNVCDQCGKSFKNERGVAVHKLRAHSGRNWDTSKNFFPRDPDPKKPRIPRALRARSLPDTMAVHFCPNCGCNLAVIAMAIQMVAPQPPPPADHQPNVSSDAPSNDKEQQA